MAQIKWNNQLAQGDMKVSVRMVMKSAAGYYIGRYCEEDGFIEPYMRETAYSTNEAPAQVALAAKSYTLRSCAENDMLYSMYPNMVQAE